MMDGHFNILMTDRNNLRLYLQVQKDTEYRVWKIKLYIHMHYMYTEKFLFEKHKKFNGRKDDETPIS